MINFLSIWLILVTFEIVLFLSYTLLMYVFFKRKKVHVEISSLPDMTLVIPVFNEEKIIKEKIINTAHLDYPDNKLKIIILDDHSNDNSKNIALKAIQETSLPAMVFESKGIKGKAGALNWLFPLLESEITVISDCDAFLKKDSLLQISKNYYDLNIGGVTGKIVPISDKTRISKSQEDAYRFYFDVWRSGESEIHSVSVCNGPLMSFRTELLKKINIDPNTYADDSDILFKIVKLGFRVIYDPEAIVFERVPLSVKSRIVQKMKRINGLRRIYLKNYDMLGKGIFGNLIFPYAILTHILSPIIILLITLLFPFIVLHDTRYAFIIIIFLIPKIGGLLISFILTQLMMNFSFLVKTSGSWTPLEDARYLLKHDN